MACIRAPRAFVPLALSVALAGVGCESGGEKNVPLGKRWLAFTLANGVYVARVDGSGMKRLTNLREFEYQPAHAALGARMSPRPGDEADTLGARSPC